ncbi:MAG: diguanylate cyclase domain-containing protein [Acidimicrobiia bacterium]
MEHVLERILASTARAVSAPAYVLALDNVPAAARRVYAVGIGEDQARRVSDEILAGSYTESQNRLVVDVVSTRRRYGRLAALQHGGRFYPQERASLDAYARLAAAALDSAAALEDARRQAATAEALLTLSSALAAIVSVDEVAVRVVRSVPEIVDCDRAAIVLIDADPSILQVAATHGYSDAAEVALRAMHFPGVCVDRTWIADPNAETGAIPDVLQHWSTEHGAARTVACPIVSNGHTLGWLSASVETRPERLDDIQRVETRLRGLTGLAATAICNSRLLDEIRYQALHDNLTGLANRALVLDHLRQLLVRARRHHTAASVLFLDLDGFKEVNDTLGHAVGDELLRLAAARLEETLRRGDTIGRLGGDEFVVLAEADLAGARPALAAERIVAAFRAPFVVGTRTVRVTASVGIAVGDREEPGELLRDADVALYRAKADGKNRYAFYAPEMHEVARDH